MNTIKKLRKTLRKRKSLLRQLWKDLRSVVAPAPRPPLSRAERIARGTPPAEVPVSPALAGVPIVVPPSRPVVIEPYVPAECRFEAADAAPARSSPKPATARKKTTTRRRRVAPAPKAELGVLAPGKRILMIDDDAAYLELAARLLRAYDCVVETVEGPEAGLRAAEQRRPDALIIDYNMPGITGFEIIQRLRTSDELANVPRIMLTGAAYIGELRESLRWDVVDVLAKPVPKQLLLETLERALGGRLPPRPAGALEPPPVHAAPPAPAAAPAPAPEEKVELLEPPPKTLKEAGAALAAQLASLADVAPDDLTIRENAQPETEDASIASLAPAVKAVATILKEAIARRASDIHIEPMQKGLQVRLRVDGELTEMMTLPLAVAPAVAARVKVLASMDIAERRLPQDGRICVQSKGRKIDLRVSTLPSLYGEKLVMRVIGMAKIDGDLTKFGLPAGELDAIRWALSQPNGLVLMTGPTGSGKSTSLYRMIASLNNGRRNIVTVEDPIEGEIEGVTQVAVNADIGLTFESALRAFLRQDPDVMLVGEIRDKETAEIAVRAAMTGRLILSTLHTNDAVATVSRLGAMGIPSYMVAAAVRLVVAQRLVRLLCKACRREDEPSPAERDVLAAGGLPLERFYRSAGCAECGGLGFSGRAPVMEVMAVKSLLLRELIRAHAPLEDIRKQACADGMRALSRAALDLVADGRTTLGEALKAASLD